MSTRYSIFIIIFSFISCNNEVEKPIDEIKVDSENITLTKSKIEELNEAIIAQPNNYTVYINRANYFLQEGQIENAKKDADRALKINPNIAEVAYTKGAVLLKTGQVEMAVPFFEHAIELDSTYASPYLKLAYINLAKPNYDKSIALINKALKINQYMAEPYFLKGMWYESQEKFDLAASSYQTAIERNPDYFDAYLNQGVLHDRLNNPLALDYFKSAISIKPNSIEAWRLLALSYRDHNQFIEAIECFDSIISIDETFEVAYFDKGRTHLDLCYDNNHKEKNDSLLNVAISLFDKAISLNNNYVPARYNRGLCYEELGNEEEAKKEYKKVLELEPNYDLAVKGMNRL